MNDVTADKYGNVYVGDTYTDTIYRLNQFVNYLHGFIVPQLAPPMDSTLTMKMEILLLEVGLLLWKDGAHQSLKVV